MSDRHPGEVNDLGAQSSKLKAHGTVSRWRAERATPRNLPKMRIVLFVAIGGAIGAVGRYLLSTPINERMAPWGPILVNLLGSAVLGFLIGWFADRSADPAIQIGLLTGVLGGFTTFSTFSAETVLLLDGGRWQLALANVFVSVLFGIVAAAIGYTYGRA